MNFSEGIKEQINVKLHEKEIQQIKQISYLGVMVDENLNFSSQVESVIGKSMSALNKVSI